MKTYKSFLLENVNKPSLKYYIFDWDDNILIMPTVIHLEHYTEGQWIPTDVSTSKFADIRTQVKDYQEGKSSVWRLKNDNYDDTYAEFRDFGPRGDKAFFEDSLESIKTNSFGPVWDKFLQCLIDGSIFMIVTARGHEPKSIRKVVEWVIYNYLNDDDRIKMEKKLRNFNELFNINDRLWSFKKLVNNFLNDCDFIGINSKYFAENFNVSGDAINVEMFKSKAIKHFTEKVNEYGRQINRKVKVGFSDDDTLTAQHVHKFLKDKLWYEFPIDYYVYHTKDGIKRIK